VRSGRYLYHGVYRDRKHFDECLRLGLTYSELISRYPALLNNCDLVSKVLGQ